MEKYAIKVMSCSRGGRINYVSSEEMQSLIDILEHDYEKPVRRGARMVDLGYMALDNCYYATALELFRKAIDLLVPGGDMCKIRMTALQRYAVFRAAEGVDAIWRRMGSDSDLRKEIKEFFAELHYRRLGIDYDEVLSEKEDYSRS